MCSCRRWDDCGCSPQANLKRALPFLESTPNALLAFIGPLILALFVLLLPPILTLLAKMEGLVSYAALITSVFVKLTLFMILQTFLVSAISGSLFQSLRQLTISPWPTVQSILSTNLPAQAGFFIGYVLLKAFVFVTLDLLRVWEVTLACLTSVGSKVPRSLSQLCDAVWYSPLRVRAIPCPVALGGAALPG